MHVLEKSAGCVGGEQEGIHDAAADEHFGRGAMVHGPRQPHECIPGQHLRPVLLYLHPVHATISIFPMHNFYPMQSCSHGLPLWKPRVSEAFFHMY
jgi:hypothetical protein